MFIEMIKTMVEIIWKLLKWPLIIGGIIIVIFLLLYFAWVIYFKYIKKMKKKKGQRYKIKKDKLLKKIFYDTPRRMALDYMNRDPEDFQEKGLVLYTGNQGGGKTSTMIRDTRILQTEYPKLKVLSNMNYKFQDEELKDWKQMLDYKNGRKGVVIQIDEIQNWFNSKASRDFPPEMTQLVTTNRKERRLIMGTAQRFYMVAKDIRTQVSEVRNCITLFGCLTIVHRQVPIIDADGNVEKMKGKGWYCWVHNDEIRNAYDTYKVIETLKKKGFVPRSEQYSAFKDNSQKVEIVEKKK